MKWLLACTMVGLLFSGCLGDSDAPVDDDSELDSDPLGAAMPPADMHESGEFTLALDPSNVATGAICTGPSVDPPCWYYDFHSDVSTDLVATLAWTNPANDLDLYLFQGDTQISNDGINTIGNVPPDLPTTEQVMRASVGPGDYRFYVVIWNGVADSYTLDVTFT